MSFLSIRLNKSVRTRSSGAVCLLLQPLTNVRIRSASRTCNTASIIANLHDVKWRTGKFDSWRDRRTLCTPRQNSDHQEKKNEDQHFPGKPDAKKQSQDAQSHSEQTNQYQSAAELSRIFDPPENVREKLPSGFFGSIQRVDAAFSFDEFEEGTKLAYVVVRQISANVKDPKLLQLLQNALSPGLLQNLKDNLADMSIADRNKGIEVHDVYAEIVGIALRMEPGAGDPEMTRMSLEERRGLVAQLAARAEWLQLRVRFVALEAPVVRAAAAAASAAAAPTPETPAAAAGSSPAAAGAGDSADGAADVAGRVVERGAAEMVRSTWTFEGKVWTVLRDGAVGGAAGDGTAAAAAAAGAGARRRNPQVMWKVIQIGV